MNNDAYDYIIAGAGAAGLSLALRLATPEFANKQILLIDRSSKRENDRTWCFWEKGSGAYDEVVYRQWESVAFFGPDRQRLLHLLPYRYKMLRGLDFYDFALKKLHDAPNVVVCKAEIYDLATNADNEVEVNTSEGSFTADWAFSSLVSNDLIHEAKKQHFLWQHFLGWHVVTEQAVFDESKPVFMDFRIPQTDGSCFVYVLPLSQREALVEYTVFSPKVWEKEIYEAGIREYLRLFYQLHDFEVLHVEQGRIPMSSYKFPESKGRVVYLGTAGGRVKASTGYAFMNIQRHSDAIANRLRQGKSPVVKHSVYQKRFSLYDNTLLHVLVNKQLGGAHFFERLLMSNPPNRVFDFLDEQSGLLQELLVMNSVPRVLFAKAFFREWFGR
jgi:lycopene beta-cyclase